MDNEEKLRMAYEKLSQEYQQQLDALRTLESIHKTSGSEAAQLKKELGLDELYALLVRRRELIGRIDETILEILMREARVEQPAEARTADPPPPAEAFQDEPSLAALNVKERYLQEQLVRVDDQVNKKSEELAALDSFSAQVAAKQEELDQLRLIKNRLKAELDRIQVERLAPDRITLVDRAQIADSSVDALRRTVGLSLAAALGIVLVALGLVIRWPQR